MTGTTISMAKKTELEQRVEDFEKELTSLQERYSLRLYATNQAMENGEVFPLVKIRDVKMYEQNNPQGGNPVNQKT